jgi:hypothetical protein
LSKVSTFVAIAPNNGSHITVQKVRKLGQLWRARTGHMDNMNAYDNYAQVPLSIVATAGRALAGWSHPKVPEVIPKFLIDKAVW